MNHRRIRSLYACVCLAAASAARPDPVSAADAIIKVAFWNIMSGKGVEGFVGHPIPYSNTSNCTDPSQPLNA
jgi:hypothetical protein